MQRQLSSYSETPPRMEVFRYGTKLIALLILTILGFGFVTRTSAVGLELPQQPPVIDGGGGQVSSPNYNLHSSSTGLGGAVFATVNYHFHAGITAQSLAPELAVTEAATLDQEILSGSRSEFHDTIIGRQDSKTFVIHNLGTVALALLSITLTGADTDAFDLSAEPLAELEPGQTMTVAVTFRPSTPGAKTATLQIASNDASENPHLIPLQGEALARPRISLGQAVYSVTQGAPSIAITLHRSGGYPAASARILTTDGTASSIPPFSAAIAGVDYVPPSENQRTITFQDYEWEKTVTLPLLGRVLRQNVRFTVNLTDLSEDAELGTHSQATIELLTKDSKPPSLSLQTPKKGTTSSIWPLVVAGTAGDVQGLREVWISLNGAEPLRADLGSAKSSSSIPFTRPIQPIEGGNTLVITARDLSGNFTELSQTFTFNRRYPLTVTRISPGQTALDKEGLVSLETSPGTAASALLPKTAHANPQTSEVVPGTLVTLTAKAGKGYAFSHWIGLINNLSAAATTTQFVMPAQDVTVSPVFVESPFGGESGTGGSFYGGLTVVEGPASLATEGYLTGTLTATGTFSGKLLIGGLAHPFLAVFMGDGRAFFKLGQSLLTSLPIGSKALTFAYAAEEGARDQILATLYEGDEGPVSQGMIRRALYSKSRPIPAHLRHGSASSSLYTLRFSSREQTPVRDLSTYPQGDGFASLKLTSAGTLTFAGVLADGSAVTASSALVHEDTSPFLSQIPTPGSPKLKGSAFCGDLSFADLPDSDVTGQNLQWFRPAVTPRSAPAAQAAATALYTAGWPEGIHTDAIGALYNPKLSIASALALSPIDASTGNAQITFQHGKLNPSLLSFAFNLSGNRFTSIPIKDTRYNLSLSATTGSFKGSFTPSWAATSKTRPAYRGILLQKGALRGGYGFFISTIAGDPDLKSGRVSLSRPR